MKKLNRIISLGLGIALISATAAFAETNFTPLNFDESSSSSYSAQSSSSLTEPKGTDLLDPSQVTGGTKMQNAILQIDNAQVDLRNQLLNYRSNYAQIDSKYNTTKEQRRAAKKQVKQAEKKIKNLDKTKKQIQKNFQRKNNM